MRNSYCLGKGTKNTKFRCINLDFRREEKGRRKDTAAPAAFCAKLFSPSPPTPYFSPSCAQPHGRRNFAKNKGWGERGEKRERGGAILALLISKNLKKKMAVVRPTSKYSGGGNPTRTHYIQHTYIHACMHTYIHTYIHSYTTHALKASDGHDDRDWKMKRSSSWMWTTTLQARWTLR